MSCYDPRVWPGPSGVSLGTPNRRGIGSATGCFRQCLSLFSMFKQNVALVPVSLSLVSRTDPRSNRVDSHHRGTSKLFVPSRWGPTRGQQLVNRHRQPDGKRLALAKAWGLTSVYQFVDPEEDAARLRPCSSAWSCSSPLSQADVFLANNRLVTDRLSSLSRR